jgi:hypothetical protein
MDVWECDLVDVRPLGIFNVTYKYVLTVIDVFSKYLHMVLLKVKSGAAVASAFVSVLRNTRYQRPAADQSDFEQTGAKNFWPASFRPC